MPNSIRIAVIGAGAFGRNHLRVLHDLERRTSTPRPSSLEPEQNPAPAPAASPDRSSLNPSLLVADRGPAFTPNVHLAAAVDANPSTRAEVAQHYGIPTFATVDDLLAADLDLTAATVAVPTVHHAAVATQLIESNLDVLVEKPLTATLAEADALIALAAARCRILAAGHLERFNPAVTAALTRLTRPMFFEAHRLSIFTPRSLDVDVVLDLMIHDLDILLTMADTAGLSPKPPQAANALVTEVRAVGLPVLSPKVDIANVRLEFRSGAIANLTASRVSTEQVRKLRLFQPAQYLSLDYARQELLTINVDPTLASGRPTATQPHTAHHPGVAAGLSPLVPTSTIPGFSPGQPHPSAGLTFDKHALPRAEPLRLELEDFLSAVAARTQPRVTGQAGRNALALALEINAAIQNHAKLTGLTR